MSLKEFATGHVFESIKICVVIINAVLLALYDPLDQQDPAVSALNIIVNVFYILEFLFLVAVLGVGQYFDRTSRIIDGLISILSFVWLLLYILVVTRAVRIDNSSHVLAAMQLARVIEPLLLIRLIPSLFSGIQRKTFLDLSLNIIFPFMMLMGFALIAHLMVEDNLQYRCIPRSLNNTAVQNNEYFQVYGEDYFFSVYNVDYCGNRKCDQGFTCENADNRLYGVLADYDDPWVAFVSNTAFMTLRGWPNIYWAINDTSGPGYAAAIFFMVSGFGTLLVFNMFVAVFVALLKSKRKYLERINWLRLYPGNIDNLTELELVLWAKRNPEVVDRFMQEVREDKSVSGFMKQIYCTVTGKHANNETNPKQSTRMKQIQQTEHSEVDATKDADDEENEEKEAFSHERKAFCVPQLSAFRYFRQQVRDPLSKWNIGVYCLVIMNVIFYAFNDVNGGQNKAQAFFIGSVVFNSIFGLELLIYFLTHGPFLYLNYWSNLFDATIILIGLFSLGLPGCRYVNIFRLFKIVRSQPKHVKGSLLEEIEFRKQLRDTDLYFSRLLAVATETVSALLLYFCLACVFIYAFAVISMRIFPETSDRGIAPSTAPVIVPQNSVLPLIRLERSFSGAFVPLFNFNNFRNAFLTVFSIMERNEWYNLAVTESIKAGFYTFWFFFIWIYLSNYIFLPALVAHVNVVVEKKALDLVRDIADQNKSLFVRFQYYVNKSMMYKAFQTLKRNTEPPAVAASSAGEAGTEEKATERRTVVEKAMEKPYAEGPLQQQLNLRKDYSFFIFAPFTWPRVYAERILKSRFFNQLLFIAICITTLRVLDSEQRKLLSNSQLKILLSIALIVYASEILLKWVYHGVFTLWRGYMFNIMNLVDFALFLLQIYIDLFGNDYLLPLEIIRIVKLPAVIHFLVKSQTLTMLARSFRRSVRSVGMVTLIFLAVCCFFGVFGMQLYRGGYGFCNFFAYPSGRSRFEKSSQFPNGCDGGSIDFTVNGQTVRFNLNWEEPADTFDNIYSAARSTFRIGLGSNYAQILFGATSYTGYETMPDRFKSPESFLFFLGMTPIMVFLRVLLAAVAYYNYTIESLNEGMKKIGISFLARQDDVIWLEVRKALQLIEPPYIPTPPDAETQPMKRFFYEMTEHIAYRLFCLSYVVVPLILALGFYSESYSRNEFVYYDLIFTGIFLIDFLCRYISIPKFLSSITAQQEVIIFFALFLAVLVVVASAVGVIQFKYAFVAAKISIVLRMHRMSAIFPQLGELLHMFWNVRNAYLSMLLIWMSVVIFYAVLGNFFMQDYNVVYNIGFLDRHYNFQTYYNSVVLLMAMGTGNVYTEVVKQLKQGKTRITKILIEFYFISFLLIFNFIMVSVVVMLIIRYMDRNLENAVIANQQIYDFIKAWKKTLKREANAEKITYADMKRLLLRLRKPLGLRSEHPVSDMILTRYANKVLMMVEDKRGKEVIDANAHVLIAKAREEKNIENKRDLFARFASTAVTGNQVDAPSEEKGSSIIEDEEVDDLILNDRVDANMGEAQQRRGCFSCCRSGEKDEGGERAKEKLFTFQQILQAVHKVALFCDTTHEDEKFQESRLIHRHRLQVMRLYLALFMVRGHRYRESKDFIEKGCKTQLVIQRLAPQLNREGFLKIFASKLSYLRQNITSFGIQDFESFMIKYLRTSIKYEMRGSALVLKKWILMKKKSSGMNAKEVISHVINAHHYHTSLNKLSRQFDELYEQYVTRQWILETITVTKKLTNRGFGPISALAVDFRTTIFAGFSTGKLKIWRNASNRPTIDKYTKFEQQQIISVIPGTRIRSIIVTSGGRKIYVACGKEIIQYVPKKRARNRRKQQFRELSPRLLFHRNNVNCLHCYDRYILSGGQDGIVAMWPLSTEQPCCYKSLSSSIFCCSVFAVIEENVPPDDVILTHALACGLSNGSIHLLPLPLQKASALKASKSWTEGGISVKVSSSAVSSICYVPKWKNYLFVGTAEGAVTTFAIIVSRKAGDQINPINMIEARPLSKVSIHAAPISALNFVGGYLFSSSHDFSILPFHQPDRLDSTNRIEYNQSIGAGLIFHESPIVSMAVNSSVLLSGDDDGNIVILTPGRVSDLNMNAANAETVDKCRFSFLEYDFGVCFVPHKGKVLEEEATLTVTNLISVPVDVRFLNKHDKHFRVEFLEILNSNVGCSTFKAAGSTLSSKEKKGLRIPPLHSGQFRILFTPLRPEKFCNAELEFLIDGKDLVKISVRGFGIKPSVTLDSQLQIKDFGKVRIGESVVKSMEVTNYGRRGVAVNLFDARSVQQDSQSSLTERGFTVRPSSFFLEGQTKKPITLHCAPVAPMNVLDVPLRFNVEHATYDLCKIRSYAAGDVKDGNHKTTEGDLTRHLRDAMNDRIQRSLSDMRGLRPLKLSEQLCGYKVVNHLLRDIGWGIAYNYEGVYGTNNYLCLMQMDTGLFLHIPYMNPHQHLDNTLSKHDVNNVLAMQPCGEYQPKDCVQIVVELECGDTWELYFGDTLLQSRTIEFLSQRSDNDSKTRTEPLLSTTGNLVKELIDVHVSSICTKEGDKRIHSYGVHVLELRVRSTPRGGGEESVIKCKTYINVQIGYTVIEAAMPAKRGHDSGDYQMPKTPRIGFQLIPRVEAVGISKCVTYLFCNVEREISVQSSSNAVKKRQKTKFGSRPAVKKESTAQLATQRSVKSVNMSAAKAQSMGRRSSTTKTSSNLFRSSQRQLSRTPSRLQSFRASEAGMNDGELSIPIVDDPLASFNDKSTFFDEDEAAATVEANVTEETVVNRENSSATSFTSCLNGKVALYESFDIGAMMNTKVKSVNPFFGDLTVAIEAFDTATHFQVKDSARVLSKDHEIMVDNAGRELNYEHSEYRAFSTTSPDLLQIASPDLPLDLKNGELVRELSITYTDESMENKLKEYDYRKLYKSITVPIHTLKHMDNRTAQRTVPFTVSKNLNNSSLPTSIFSTAGSCSVHVPEGNKFHTLQNYLRRGYDDEIERGRLFGGQWYLVMDGASLKLVSGRSNDVSDGMDDTTLGSSLGNSKVRVAQLIQGSFSESMNNDKSVASEHIATCYLCGDCGTCANCIGFTQQSKSRKGRQPEIVAHSEPYMDITLTAHGLTAVSSVDGSFWHLEDGKVTTYSKSKPLLPELSPLKPHTIANSIGGASRLENAPEFMKTIWRLVYRDQVRNMIKYSMRLKMEQLDGRKKKKIGAQVAKDDNDSSSSDEETKQQSAVDKDKTSKAKVENEKRSQVASVTAAHKVKKLRRTGRKNDEDQIDDEDDPANDDLSAEALLRRTEGKIYRVFLELSDLHHCTFITELNKRNGVEDPVVAPTYMNPDAVLNFVHLMDYLKSEDLPGYAGAFPAPMVEIGLQTMHHDENNAVSLRGFFLWYNHSESKRAIEELKPRNIYGQLLEEEVGDLMKWRSKTMEDLIVEIDPPSLFAIADRKPLQKSGTKSKQINHANVTTSKRKSLEKQYSVSAMERAATRYVPILNEDEVIKDHSTGDRGRIIEELGVDSYDNDSSIPSMPPPPPDPAPLDMAAANAHGVGESKNWFANLFFFGGNSESKELPPTMRFAAGDETKETDRNHDDDGRLSAAESEDYSGAPSDLDDMYSDDDDHDDYGDDDSDGDEGILL